MHLRRVVLHPDRYPTAEKYPFNLSIFRETPQVEFRTPVTFFVGENGTGKSTLLRALANRCDIHIWKGIERERFEYNPFEQALHRAIHVEWLNGPVPGSYFDSEEFRNFARLLDEWAAGTPGILGYFGGKSLMTQSHGQSLMSFFKGRYSIKGLYFADEPETALSPRTQLELLAVLEQMAGEGHAQFIIATHSPILLACRGATIYSFDHAPVRQVAYEETDHYQVYSQFMADRAASLSGGVSEGEGP